jgi:predicted dinucleotide-binding enzyme
MWAGLMVNQQMIADGDHSNFICGNDVSAKQVVRSLLTDI